jgi:hypothetical protein
MSGKGLHSQGIIYGDLTGGMMLITVVFHFFSRWYVKRRGIDSKYRDLDLRKLSTFSSGKECDNCAEMGLSRNKKFGTGARDWVSHRQRSVIMA